MLIENCSPQLPLRRSGIDTVYYLTISASHFGRTILYHIEYILWIVSHIETI